MYEIYSRSTLKKLGNSTVMGFFAAAELMLLTYYCLLREDEDCFKCFNRSSIFEYSFYSYHTKVDTRVSISEQVSSDVNEIIATDIAKDLTSNMD